MFCVTLLILFFSNALYCMEKTIAVSDGNPCKDFFTKHKNILETPNGQQAFCNVIDYLSLQLGELKNASEIMSAMIATIDKHKVIVAEADPSDKNNTAIKIEEASAIPITPALQCTQLNKAFIASIDPTVKNFADSITRGKKKGIFEHWKKIENKYIIYCSLEDPEEFFNVITLCATFNHNKKEIIESALRDEIPSIKDPILQLNFALLFNLDLLQNESSTFFPYQCKCAQQHYDHIENIINKNKCIQNTLNILRLKKLPNGYDHKELAMISDLYTILDPKQNIAGTYDVYTKIIKNILDTFIIRKKLFVDYIGLLKSVEDSIERNIHFSIYKLYEDIHTKLLETQIIRNPLFFGRNNKPLSPADDLFGGNYNIQKYHKIQLLHELMTKTLNDYKRLINTYNNCKRLINTCGLITDTLQEAINTQRTPESENSIEKKESTDETVCINQTDDHPLITIEKPADIQEANASITIPTNTIPHREQKPSIINDLIRQIKEHQLIYNSKYIQKCIELGDDNYHNFPWVLDALVQLYGFKQEEKKLNSTIFYWPIVYKEIKDTSTLNNGDNIQNLKYVIYKIVKNRLPQNEIFHRGPVNLENPNMLFAFNKNQKYFKDIIDKALLSEKMQKNPTAKQKKLHRSDQKEEENGDENYVITKEYFSVKDPFHGIYRSTIERITNYCIVINAHNNIIYFPLVFKK